MLTLFLMLLSPPTSPSPRVENPRAAENRILIEQLLREDRQAAIEAAARKAEREQREQRWKADAERAQKRLRELDERIKEWEERIKQRDEKREPAKK